MNLKRGVLIRVRAFGGKEIVRRFLAKRHGTVLICSDEEYQSALLEKRKPTCVGFPISDVIAPASISKMGNSNRLGKRKAKNLTARRNYHA
jgi:hypothetical protein